MNVTRQIIRALVSISLLGATIPALADDAFEAGMAAAEREEYGEAIELWTPLGQAGDERAMFNLAIAHFRHYLGVEDADERRLGLEAGWIWMQLAERFGVSDAEGQKEKQFGRWFPGEMEQRVNRGVDDWLERFCSDQSSHRVCPP